MKRRIRIVAFVLAAMSVFATGAWAQELKVGDMAPDFTLKASDGQTYTLSKLKGKNRGVGVVPKSVYRWLNRRMSSAP